MRAWLDWGRGFNVRLAAENKAVVVKRKTQILAGAVWLTLTASAFAQGTFQNLDFEAANLPSVPVGGFVSSLSAIPSWTAYFSTNVTTQIWHNNYALGAVNISIIGPGFSGPASFPVIQGSYSVFLQSGLDGTATTRMSAAIAQTGIIPLTAMSLRFSVGSYLAGDPAQLVVSIGGQNIPIFPLTITASQTVYGADISGFAGQTKELRLTSFPSQSDPYHYFLIDSIAFSNQQIPEPNALGLIGIGALMFGWRLKTKRLL